MLTIIDNNFLSFVCVYVCVCVCAGGEGYNDMVIDYNIQQYLFLLYTL